MNTGLVVSIILSLTCTLVCVQCNPLFPVICDVGINGTYVTIQDAIIGCNGSVGDIKILIENGTYFEPGLIFPATLRSVNMSSLLEQTIAAPQPENMTVHITGVGHQVLNDTTTIWAYGIWFDGNKATQSLFFPRLVNNNITFINSLISDFRGNTSIQIESCEEVTVVTAINCRFLRIWGSAIYAEGISDYLIYNNTFDKCGGLNNHSCVYLRGNAITTGIMTLEDNAHWLFMDRQINRCNQQYDADGMVQCIDSVLQCYSSIETATRGSCPLVNTTFFNITSNETETTLDYRIDCRVYLPCTCANIEAVNDTTGAIEFYSAGDLFFYTGLVLKCYAMANATFQNITGTTFVKSLAGQPSQPGGEFGVTPFGVTPFGNMTGWTMGMFPLDNTIIIAPPFNGSNPMINEFDSGIYIIPGTNDTVSVMNSEPLNTTDEQVLRGACYCNGSAEITLLLPCNYNITYDLTTISQFNLEIPNQLDFSNPANNNIFILQPLLNVFAENNYTAYNLSTIVDQTNGPNNNTGIFCLNGDALCCADFPNCTVWMPCLCPFQVNYSDPNQYDQEQVVFGTYIIYFILSLNATLIPTYQLNTGLSITDMIAMTLALLNINDAGDPLQNATFSEVLTTMSSYLPSSISCMFTGDCPLPTLNNLNLAFDLNCTNRTTSNPLGLIQCFCDDDTIIRAISPYQISNYSAAYELENIPPTIGLLTLLNNRAQQLPIGMILNQVSFATMVNNTLHEPFYFDELGIMREPFRDNPLLSGTWHDMMYGAKEYPEYQRFCDQLCRQEFSQISDLNITGTFCIVDNSAGAAESTQGGISIYYVIQDAIDANCPVIVIVGTQNFYAENLDITDSVNQMISFNSATIVGVHTLEQDTILFRGILFQHPGDKSDPLFSRSIHLKNITILNCGLDGNGVRSGGIFSLQSQETIDFLTFNYTTISNWNYYAMQLWQVQTFDVNYCTFSSIRGQAIAVKFLTRVTIANNVYLNVRGISGLSGVNIIEIVAIGDSGSFFGATTGTSIGGPCNSFPRCRFNNNIQQVDITSADYDDTFALFQQGGWAQGDIFDNQVLKANTGFRFREVSGITLDTVAAIVLDNSLVRPSNFGESTVLNQIALNTGLAGVSNGQVSNRIDSLTNGIRDFRIDLFYYSPSSGYYLRVFNNFGCNYPCTQVAGPNVTQYTCEVNDHYDIGYIDQYGYQTFHNWSQGIYFCRATDETNQVAITIAMNGTGWHGSRLIKDNITALFPISMQGVVEDWEYSDPRGPPCSTCYPRNVVYGNGHFIIADPFIAQDLEYRLDFLQFGIDLWRTDPQQFPVYNVTFRRVTLNARYLPPFSTIYLLDLQMGYDWNAAKANQPQPSQGGTQPNYQDSPPTPNQQVIIDGCIFTGFYPFDPSRLVGYNNSQNGSANEHPYCDGLRVSFINNVRTFTQVTVINCIFYGDERRPLEVQGGQSTTIANNTFAECGGRSPNNYAVVLVSGDLSMPGGFLNFSDNQLWQDNPVLYPVTVQVRTVWLSAYVIFGYTNDSIIVFRNNSARDITIGFRAFSLTLGNATVDGPFINGLPANNTPMYFDNVDTFRRLFREENQGIKGVLYDMIFCPPYKDFSGLCLTCSNGCVPPDPEECMVSLTNVTFQPNHPWMGRFMFTDLPGHPSPINWAIQNCSAPSYRIRVDPNTPYTPYNETIVPIFFSNNTIFNDTVFSVPTVICQGPIGTTVAALGQLFTSIAFSGPLATINNCGHHLDIGRLRMENCIFDDTCAGSTPTWQQDPPAPFTPLAPPLLLEIVGCQFNGNDGGNLAVNGTFNNGFLLDSNTFANYSGLDVVDIVGSVCNYDQVTVTNNVWDGPIAGTALSIQNVAGYDMASNIFNQCGCTDATRNMCVYLDVCAEANRTAGAQLVFATNQINGSSPNNPLPQPYGPGYFCTGYYLNNVPDTSMSVDIDANYGTNMPGTCMRFIDLPNSFPITDPKQKLRHYALNKHNMNCRRGAGYDLEQAPLNFTDVYLQNNEPIYPGRFCNDGCSRTNGSIVAILVSIPIGLFIIVLLLCLCCRTRPVGVRTYFSGQLQETIATEPTLISLYGIDPARRIAQQEAKKQQANSVVNALRERMGFGGSSSNGESTEESRQSILPRNGARRFDNAYS